MHLKPTENQLPIKNSTTLILWRYLVIYPSMTHEQVSCTILGSFKFKPEIDQAIEQFESSGIKVLAPRKGKVLQEIQKVEGRSIQPFGLVAGEEQMDPGAIELDFVRKMGQSTFLYIVCPGGYAGLTVAGEIGAAIGYGLPIYSTEPLDPKLEDHPFWIGLTKIIKPYSLDEMIKMAKSRQFDIGDYFWIKYYDPMRNSVTSPSLTS